MNIDVYTLCWNEMAILPFVIETWKKFARHVYVFDNGSTDGSVEFLKKYDWITVEPFGNSAEKSNKQNSNIKNTKWKGSDADYIFACDIDECLVGKDVIKTLEDCKEKGATVVETEWYNFVNPEKEMPKYEEGKTLYEVSPYAVRDKKPKVTIFDPKKITDINYTVGAHQCSPRGTVKRFKAEGLYIHHINNALSLDYRLKRYEMQGARLSQEDKRKRWGVHYGFDKARITRGYNESIKNKINFNELLGNSCNDNVKRVSSPTKDSKIKMPPSVARPVTKKTASARRISPPII